MIKLTKYSHACVLAEDDDHVTLFDPGQFAWETGLFEVSKLEKLDYVIITHEHFDHFYEPFIQKIIKLFPDVQFISTENVLLKLKDLGAKNASEESTSEVNVSYLAHASMAPLDSATPQNIRVHYKDSISHPGDSLQLKETKDVLFLPLAGPWGSTIDAIRMAEKLRPQTVVPIHDWMWNDQWRQTMYKRMEQYFESINIRFVLPENGKSFEVY